MSDSSPLIIANLKAHKTWEQMQEWIDKVGENAINFPGTIIVSPSTAFIAAAGNQIKSKNYNLKLAIQDVSRFKEGAYTGEVAASQVKDICHYAIIGHSERRQNFKDEERSLNQKVENTKAAQIEPIFCVQGKNTEIPSGIKIVAYEPVFAIGTGNPDTPDNAQEVAKSINSKDTYTMIYGGSVTGENVENFLEKDFDGVLVGTDSIDSQDFIAIIKASQ